MSRDEFIAIGIELNGGKNWGWQTRLAEALEVDGSTIRRWVSGAVSVPGPAGAAVRCLRESKRLRNIALTSGSGPESTKL